MRVLTLMLALCPTLADLHHPYGMAGRCVRVCNMFALCVACHPLLCFALAMLPGNMNKRHWFAWMR